MYNEVKQNLIKRFFNPIYKFTCVSNINIVYNDLRNRLPFDFSENNDTITINLGNDVIIDIKVIVQNIDNKCKIVGFE